MFCDWKTSDDWRKHITAAGFSIVSQVIWNRLHHGMGDLLGAFAPMHDIIWYAVKDRRKFKNGRPKSVLDYRRPSPKEDFGHPTCKPIDLMDELVKITEGEGDNTRVIDPFMGSGTTGVACVNLGREFTGIELEPTYFDIACNRISEAVGTKT